MSSLPPLAASLVRRVAAKRKDPDDADTAAKADAEDPLPGLDSFHIIGHWTTPGGGLPPAVSGRHVVQVICKQDGKQFVAAMP